MLYPLSYARKSIQVFFYQTFTFQPIGCLRRASDRRLLYIIPIGPSQTSVSGQKARQGIQPSELNVERPAPQ